VPPGLVHDQHEVLIGLPLGVQDFQEWR
jgi:hypothetical protein